MRHYSRSSKQICRRTKRKCSKGNGSHAAVGDAVVDAARKSIIRQARKLQDKGELILPLDGGDFVYRNQFGLQDNWRGKIAWHFTKLSRILQLRLLR